MQPLRLSGNGGFSYPGQKICPKQCGRIMMLAGQGKDQMWFCTKCGHRALKYSDTGKKH